MPSSDQEEQESNFDGLCGQHGRQAKHADQPTRPGQDRQPWFIVACTDYLFIPLNSIQSNAPCFSMVQIT